MRSSVLYRHAESRLRALFIGLVLLTALGTWPAPARAQSLPDFTELVERVGPAVVKRYSYGTRD